MKDGIKVLLGAVPFGENNIGDEAILESVIGIVRSVCPSAELTVCTSDRVGTARKFGVQTAPLFGFSSSHDPAEMRRVLSAPDVYVWSGATGLSDYPENAVELLETAQKGGAKTVIWGVGMNDQLNPVKYKVLPGRRRRLLERLFRLSGRRVHFVALQEAHWCARARESIRRAVTAADLVVTRDYPSRVQLKRCGVERPIIVGADSAIRMQGAAWDSIKLATPVRELLESNKTKIGLCISAQREVSNRSGLVEYLDQVVNDDSTRILFIPMNPITDAQLMEELQSSMKHPERTVLLRGEFEPAETTALVAKMDLVIASRLHLLILASIAHVPIIGIARGSKVDNFLQPYGLKPVGSVEDCDFPALRSETLRLLAERESFEARSKDVRTDLMARLEGAQAELRQVFESV